MMMVKSHSRWRCMLKCCSQKDRTTTKIDPILSVKVKSCFPSLNTWVPWEIDAVFVRLSSSESRLTIWSLVTSLTNHNDQCHHPWWFTFIYLYRCRENVARERNKKRQLHSPSTWHRFFCDGTAAQRKFLWHDSDMLLVSTRSLTVFCRPSPTKAVVVVVVVRDLVLVILILVLRFSSFQNSPQLQG